MQTKGGFIRQYSMTSYPKARQKQKIYHEYNNTWPYEMFGFVWMLMLWLIGRQRQRFTVQKTVARGQAE